MYIYEWNNLYSICSNKRRAINDNAYKLYQ